MTTAALGAIVGLSIFVGLPIARMRVLPKRVQGFFNAAATGILVFLLWDILAHAGQPIESAVRQLGRGNNSFVILALIFTLGFAAGLLGLVYFNGMMLRRIRDHVGSPSPRNLTLMIAGGLGLHNLSEGLAIGQSAAIGALAFAGVLVIGFALHNVTEGFGIAAPMTLEESRPTWGFLGVAGVIGGGPTFVGTLIGYVATSSYLYVAFLAVAAGALVYVINELFALGRRINTPPLMAWGLLTGFLVAFGTDLFLTYATGA
jgi:ZIP family zinc transporter